MNSNLITSSRFKMERCTVRYGERIAGSEGNGEFLKNILRGVSHGHSVSKGAGL